jgi:hypothetical protein
MARRILRLPEFNIVIFAFLLNFPWEFLQVPFFKDLPTAPHWEATQRCVWATLGDTGVALIAYWVTALLGRSRGWIFAPRPSSLVTFILADVAISSVIEELSTHRLSRWTYSDWMPIVPFMHIGLLPLLQAAVLTPLILWFVHRQLS